MKEKIKQILLQIDLEIDEIDLYGYDIIETSLSMIHKLQAILNDLRTKMQTYVFPTKEDEILFFKTQKPELLGRLLFFYKIYRIETQCPTGSNEIIRLYLNNELDSLTYFFNRNLDFYQYYRSHSTVHDELYFLRGKVDFRLCTDSAQFEKLECDSYIEEKQTITTKIPIRFTGKKNALIELGYALVSSGDINHGNIEIKEFMEYLSSIFNIDLGGYYDAYIAMKERKDQTAYLNLLAEKLSKRMREDDNKR